MKLAQANIRSMNTSIDLVTEVCRKQNIDVFAISEIWHPKEKIDSIKNKWNWVASERKDRQGGGVALMVNKSVKMFVRKDLHSDILEAVWVNVYSKSVNTIVGSVYVPPGKKEGLTELVKVMDTLSKEKLPILLMGDFNASHSSWGSKKNNNLGLMMFNMLQKQKKGSNNRSYNCE